MLCFVVLFYTIVHLFGNSTQTGGIILCNSHWLIFNFHSPVKNFPPILRVPMFDNAIQMPFYNDNPLRTKTFFYNGWKILIRWHISLVGW